MRRIMLMVTVALVMAAMIAASGLPALAGHVPDVRPHQHYLITDNGKLVRVGPNVCADLPDAPPDQHGFNNFHLNVHVNEDHPADITARGC